MFCPKCGNELVEGAAFCGKCGAKVAAGGDVAADASGATVNAVGTSVELISTMPATQVAVTAPTKRTASAASSTQKTSTASAALYKAAASVTAAPDVATASRQALGERSRADNAHSKPLLALGLSLPPVVLLAFSLLLLALSCFMNSLYRDVVLISVPTQEAAGWLVQLFYSWYAVAGYTLLFVINFVLLFYLNRRRARNAFLCIALALTLDVIACIAIWTVTASLVATLPDAWQNAFADSAPVFRDYMLVVCIVFASLTAVCLSLRSCASALRKKACA